jgi:hypothetical protein
LKIKNIGKNDLKRKYEKGMNLDFYFYKNEMRERVMKSIFIW